MSRAQEQYVSPAVGSIAPLVSKRKDIAGAITNNLITLLEDRGLINQNTIMPIHEYKPVVHLKDYLNRFPKRVQERHWIDTGKGLAVIHPETLIPFFLNETGSKICRLCDGMHNIKEILDTFQKKWPSIPNKVLETDFMKFLLLTEELDLVKLQ